MVRRALIVLGVVALCVGAIAYAQLERANDSDPVGKVELTRAESHTKLVARPLVVPWHVNYQGYLTDDVGNPTNDTLSMTFRIYTDSTGGTQLWTESQSVVVEGGIFNVVLGSLAPIPWNVFQAGESRWLELQVETQTLSPRTEVTSVAYAYRAVNADTADYASEAAPDSDWVIAGNEMYSAVTGAVGIGLMSPQSKLHVGGRIMDTTGYVMPVGAILPYAGATAPDGWLLCNGDTVNNLTYPDLFSVIGYTYGGSASNFVLPDLQGRTPVGRDTLDTSFDVLGETGGEKDHALTVTEMPGHNHGVNDLGHSHTIFDPGHNHAITDPGHNHWINLHDALAGTGRVEGTGDAPAGSRVTEDATTGISIDFGSTFIVINDANANVTILSQGGGQPHNNLQPYITLNYIIKY
jgi:microcystin-dependent protein